MVHGQVGDFAVAAQQVAALPVDVQRLVLRLAVLEHIEPPPNGRLLRLCVCVCVRPAPTRVSRQTARGVGAGVLVLCVLRGSSCGLAADVDAAAVI